MKKSISRRQFLQGLGGVTLALPFMPSLLSKEALSQALGHPGIFIQLISPNAIDHGAWYPNIQHTAMTALNNSHITDHVRRTPLSQFASSGISTIFDSSYASQYKHYTLIKGLGIYGPKPGHHSGGMTLGSHHGIEFDTSIVKNPTLDKVLEASSKFYPSGEGVVLKNLSVSTTQTHGGSHDSAGNRQTCHINPHYLFELFFGNQSGGAQTNHDFNVLNAVIEDYRRIKNHSRISYDDSQLLQERMDMIADVQNSLNRDAQLNCTEPQRPSSFPSSSQNTTLANTEAHTDALYRVSMAAIKCGLTRILIWNEMNPKGLLHYIHHGSSHGGDPNWDVQIDYQKWIHNKIFSRMVADLDTPDGTGGTYLDRTGLFHIVENGGNGILHDFYNVTMIAAGKMNGWINPGYFWDYNYYKAPNISHTNYPVNGLWTHILEAQGLTYEDYKTPNQPGNGFGFFGKLWGPGWPAESGYYKDMYRYSSSFDGGGLPFLKAG